MKYLYGIFLLTVGLSCEKPPTVDVTNIEVQPAVVPADQKYAGVYKSLDGQWSGQFVIYRDTAPALKKEDLLYSAEYKMPNISSLIREDTVQVQQEYVSESPYFQRVVIQDIYPEKNDTILSRGVNKVQNGEMWCVVKKPEETVVHRGKKEGLHTIIWERKKSDPQVIEYFRETVEDGIYHIKGWGYYAGDDTTRMPPYWFSGSYERSSDN